MNRIVYIIMAVVAGLVVSITGAGSANAATPTAVDNSTFRIAVKVVRDHNVTMLNKETRSFRTGWCNWLAHEADIAELKRTFQSSTVRGQLLDVGLSSRQAWDAWVLATGDACIITTGKFGTNTVGFTTSSRIV